MTHRSLLLCVLVLLMLFSNVSTPMLRENLSHIPDFYEANDDLDTALLDQSVEEYFKVTFACQAMNNILGFYLGTVLPTALADETEDTRNLKPHMQSIQQIFDQLKSDVHTCRHYFSCKQPFDITSLNSFYTQMESKGLYKAMGELDLLFNYIETYLASKRRRTHLALFCIEHCYFLWCE
ncbi:interleukin-10-like [Sparus aurata]|uniref:interleukin-10-like n=1 Tax=Sparus aurata TaxID=8175 RepID=UPI0011C132A5|nr:interleukin-10-like [Sparus aurata]